MRVFEVHGNIARVHAGPGFVTPKDPTVTAPPATPRLAIDDPLAFRLKKNAEAEERYEKQRLLIKAYKNENPRASTNQMFTELGQKYPEIFSDPDDDEVDDQAVPVLDVKGRLAAKRAVISHFREAHPELSVDEIYHRLSRLNPEYFAD